MAATPIDLSNAVQKALEDLYRRKVDPHTEIQPDLFKGFVDTFDLAVAEGFKNKPEVSSGFRERILHSNEVFSAFKVHRMQEDIAAKMLDDEGNIKSFGQFAEDVKGITSHQCRQWLRTEYDTAVKRASLAADWQRFEEEKDVLPNLRWVPSTAAEPNAEHRAYWNTVLPIDHPFWSRHKPGDRWGCQCSLEATDDPVTNTPTSIDHASPGLDNNPGKDGRIFSESHPYFPDSCQDCPFYKGGGRDGFTNLSKEDCARCTGIEDVLSMLREKRKDEELSPQMIERLQQYWELSKNPDYLQVEFNEENGGIRAVHKGHNKPGPHENKVLKEFTGKDLEIHCQDNLFRMGEICILEDESLKVNGKAITSLDSTTMGNTADIASLTENGRNTYFNTFARKDKQIHDYNAVHNKQAHTLVVYFEDTSMYDETKLRDAFKRYQNHASYHGEIKAVICVLNGAPEPIIIK